MSQVLRPSRWSLTLALAVMLSADTRPTQAAGQAPDPLLPNDTAAVLTINVRQILDSPIARKQFIEHAKAELDKNKEAGETFKALGFDPFQDVSTITLAGPNGGEGLMIFHGKFDPAKFKTGAEDYSKKNADKLKVVKEGDYTLYQTQLPNPATRMTQDMYLAIIDETTLAGARKSEYVVEALDKKAGKKTQDLSKGLKDLLAKADPKQNVSFVVTEEALGKGPLAAVPQVQQFLQDVKGVRGGFTVAEDVRMNIVFTSTSGETAQALSDRIKDGLVALQGLLALPADQMPGLQNVIDAVKQIKVQPSGSEVAMNGEISAEAIQKATGKDK